MAVESKTALKAHFETGDKPTETHFGNLIDTMVVQIAIPIAISDETSDLTTGTGKLTYYMPAAFTLTDIHACVTTAPVGAAIIIDVNDGGTSIMTTDKLVIDDGENDTTTAATGPTLTDTAIAAGAALTFDIDQIGSGTAGAGAKVTLIGYWT